MVAWFGYLRYANTGMYVNNRRGVILYRRRRHHNTAALFYFILFFRRIKMGFCLTFGFLCAY